MYQIRKIVNSQNVVTTEEAPATTKERSVVTSAVASTPRANKYSSHEIATPRTLRVS